MERQMSFMDEMVRAILDGRKTQTRRLIKSKHLYEPLSTGYEWFFQPIKDGMWEVGARNPTTDEELFHSYLKPPCVAGDVLWVQEKIDNRPEHGNFYYRVDDQGVGESVFNALIAKGWSNKKTINSIDMPREAARLLLRVKRVSVERLQDISQEDIEREGLWYYSQKYRDEICIWRDCASAIQNTRIKYFKILWDSIYVKRGYSFKSNPWVWVIEFERIQGVD